MPRPTSIYICQQCGYQSPNFLGKCPECGTWNSLVEQITNQESKKSRGVKKILNIPQLVNLKDINKTNYKRIPSGFSEVDRVLGGGIVIGSLVLISGDPGIGKSTLLTQIALNVDNTLRFSEGKRQGSASKRYNFPERERSRSLYISGEESAQQIKIRAERINPKPELAILNEVDVDVITSVLESIKPPFVIVDSIQTIQTQDLQSTPGSVGQVRESAHRLQRVAKTLHIPIILVGHVTKEGTVAGPKTLEHLVDTVLSLEGDPSTSFRILRSFKNRFGPTDEVGVFEMEETGVTQVKNPSQLFLEHKVDAPGSAVAVTMTGLRPLLVEIQALTSKSFAPLPKRAGVGVDNNRLQILVATLSKRLNLPLWDKDVFVNVTGGLRLTEPAVDLAICLAIISSLQDKTIPQNTAFVGEIGLLGELRNVRYLDKRTSEAKKLGFNQIISPSSTKSLSEAVKLILK